MVLCFTIVPTLALGHTWPNQMHTEGAIPGDKSVSTCRWPLLSSAKAKSRRSYKATPPYILMTWCISKHRPPPLHSTCTEQVEVHSVTTQHHAPQHNMPLVPSEANNRYINESILEWKHGRAKAVRGTARRYIILYTAVTENYFCIYGQVFHWHEKVLPLTDKNSFDLHSKGSMAHFWANLPETSPEFLSKNVCLYHCTTFFLLPAICYCLLCNKLRVNNYHQIVNDRK